MNIIYILPLVCIIIICIILATVNYNEVKKP